MLQRTELHKTKKSYTKTDTVIELDETDVPNPKKGMIPHWGAIRIQFSKLQLDNITTIKDLWSDVIVKVFHKLNLSLKNNKFLIESCDGLILQLMKDLYSHNTPWRIPLPIADNQVFKPEIIIPLRYAMDTAEFVHACDLFYSLKFEYDTSKATAGITIDNFDFDVRFDLHWFNTRKNSPVRTWQWRQGSDNGVVLPNNGRHQFVTLMRPAGSDENLWADGFDISGTPNNFGVTSSLPLQQAFGADFWPGGATPDEDDDIAAYWKDHACPLIYSPRLQPEDGLSTELQVIRRKNTDPTPDLIALTVK